MAIQAYQKPSQGPVQGLFNMIKSYYSGGATTLGDKNNADNKSQMKSLGSKLDPQNPAFVGPQRPTAEENSKNDYSFDGNPMERRMGAQDQAVNNDPSNPVHQQTIDAGLEQLPNSGLPKEQQDYIASLLIAGKTHGPGGYSTDHLFGNQGPQSYADEIPGE